MCKGPDESKVRKEKLEKAYVCFRERMADDLLKSLNKAKLNHRGTLLMDEMLEIFKKGEF